MKLAMAASTVALACSALMVAATVGPARQLLPECKDRCESLNSIAGKAFVAIAETSNIAAITAPKTMVFVFIV